eukprot:gb/GECH01007372.1/.p1 GENE.gb/GECH01007372.1/~~gb/GECH01007372.1/.p1  ORF type:complete len:196 (+),score=30.64 gb/GECH01007372.1/:1-588(+)
MLNSTHSGWEGDDVVGRGVILSNARSTLCEFWKAVRDWVIGKLEQSINDGLHQELRQEGISAMELLAGVLFYTRPNSIISEDTSITYTSFTAVRASRILGCACLALGVTSLVGLLSRSKRVKRGTAIGLAAYHSSLLLDSIVLRLSASPLTSGDLSADQLNEAVMVAIIHSGMLLALVPALRLSSQKEENGPKND